MPREWLRLKCVFVCLAVLLLPAVAAAQSGVRLTGTISESVFLSVVPDAVEAGVVSNGNTVRITLSDEVPVIRVPLLVRSNSSFRISALIESGTDLLSELSIVDVRATGQLVSPHAVTGLNVPPQFDSRGLAESAPSPVNSPDFSRPFVLVSGPRITLGGTLDFPNNALQITLLIRLKPQPPRGSLVHLTLSGATGS